ncbi:MAG: surface antigen [Firmicutes bacterium]|nr:surface antigen [Bacillota bacterium]
MVLALMFAATWVAYAAPATETPPATVTPAATPVSGNPPQDLTGKKVAFVDIAGAVNVKPDMILAVTRLKPGDVWTPEKVRQDLRLIYEMGIFSDVTADFTAIPEGVKVVYNVKENPVLKGISIQGNTKVAKEKILSFVTVKNGEVLNSKTVASNLRAIEEYYKAQGYILAKTGDVSFSPEGMLTVRINEGVVEDIVVKGNTKSKAYVVTREMRTKKGEPFNAKDARRSMQKLYNLGFFEDVNLKLLPGKQPGGTVLEVTVVEQKTGTFSIGGGYSNSDGLVGILSIGDKNFRGTGDNANVHWEFGGKASSAGNYSVSYLRPWIDNKQTSLGLTVYNMLNQYTSYYTDGNDDATYNRRYGGFDVTLGRPTNDNLTHYITLKNRKDEYVEYVSGQRYSADYIQNNFGLTRSIILSRVFDGRDSNTNPSEGTRYSLTAEIAGLGGDFDFKKYTAEARHYWKVGKSQVVAVRGIMGYGSGSIPYMQQFVAGGSNTLRGYRDDQFKGNRLFATTMEYRFPIAKRVQAAFFTDIGNAWQSDSFDLIKDLKVGYGMGVRVVTPFGPIRFDYAFGSQGSRTHFTFGGQF